ncbi:FxSxx-COOH cyclophane-containing RiPP peptide [Kitasatospora sp. KL5]|uniref:FxSxx-COOH cyclophane-containing RiPP peptide n=1 Tax=Kitasatospora sp. KL5 TaxID=3425125 RepID=UPI003D700C4E
MPTSLSSAATIELTDNRAESARGRASLAELAALDADELVAQLERALPDVAARQVPVAAFQSSI